MMKITDSLSPPIFIFDPSSMQLGSNVPFPRQLTVTRDGDIMISPHADYFSELLPRRIAQ